MSSAHHRIRLSAAWNSQLIPAVEYAGTPAAIEPSGGISLRLPAELKISADQILILVRRFHRPTGLRAESLIHIVFEQLPANTEVWLNGSRIQSTGGVSFLISGVLQDSNLLCVVFLNPADLVQPFHVGDVWLEIESVDPVR